ncbi:MAG TPA: efflux RND transporter permease subunit [Tissierellales bacterium]|nr:efflux RND transporter permease subunit [Tissierellales bacterium]
MSLYDFSVKKPVTTFMIVLVVIILGVVSLTKLPLDLLPKIEIPIAIVNTNYSGAGPREIEKLVTEPIEGVIATVSNVEKVSSISYEGNSIVVVEFNSGTNMDFATLEMREKVDLIKGYLPKDINSPMIMKVDPNAMPVLQLAMYSEDDLGRLQGLIEDVVKPRIERIEGVANVSLSGGTEEEVEIIIDEGILANYGLNIDNLSQLITSENLNLPAGQVHIGDKKLTLKTVGEFTSIKDIEDIPIPLPTGGVIYLRDLGKVSIENKEVNTVSRINGKEGINISVQKQSGVNTVSVSREVQKELKKILDEYPDIKTEIVVDQAEYIVKSIFNVFQNALIGAVLAVFILYLFLRDVRTTLIISLSIPISVIATFVPLYFRNITINIMTLGGIALGIGMLVDNSIVVLENIYRYHEEGNAPKIAAVKGAKEVSMAVTASTLTTMAVFLPIVFVEGMTSTIFKELALTVSFSLLMSLLVSLTLIPILSSRTLGKKKEKKEDKVSSLFEKVQEFYNKVLRNALNHRAWAMGITVIIFVGAIAPLFLIGGEFFPPIDEGMFIVDVKLPEGTDIKETNNVLTEIEKELVKINEVDTVFSTIGGGVSVSSMGSSTNSNNGNIVVVLKPFKERSRETFQVAEEVRNLGIEVPGAEISVDASSDLMAGLGGDAVNIAIKGEDLDVLQELGEDFKEIVESVEGTREVKHQYEEGMPEVRILIDRDVVSQFGLTTFQIANSVRGNVSGVTASRFKYGGTELDIVIKGQDNYREDFTELKSLPISTPLGTTIPLDELADLSVEKGPTTVYREGQSRIVNVTSQLLDRDMGHVIDDIEEKLKDYSMPNGYSYSFEGQYEQLQKAYKDLTIALILALVLVFLILAAQFESFRYPFIVILSVPLAFSGGALGLLLSGKTLSVPAIVGAIILAGIVVNNAIVLVDYINTLRREGIEMEDAIMKAGNTRLRPILMTTLTTVLGLIPLALRKGEGAELQSPMAITVISGLLFSTVLTLVIIPVLYTLLDKKGFND